MMNKLLISLFCILVFLSPAAGGQREIISALPAQSRGPGTYAFGSIIIPAAATSVGLSIDRTTLLDPIVHIEFRGDISTDNGVTWKVGVSATTGGGVITREGVVSTESSWRIPLPSCQPTCRIRGSLTINGATVNIPVRVQWFR